MTGRRILWDRVHQGSGVRLVTDAAGNPLGMAISDGARLTYNAGDLLRAYQRIQAARKQQDKKQR